MHTRGNHLETVAGTIECSGSCSAGRGTRIKTRGGAGGWYVGTTRCGTEWVAYEDEDFEPMCDEFDRRWK